MDHFRLLLSSMFLLIIVAKANHATLEPLIYWRTILPHTPMPRTIEKLLQPEVNYGKAEISANVGHSGLDFRAIIYDKFEINKLQDAPAIALFFHRKELRPGNKFTLELADSTAAMNPGFIPRSAAESIPFSSAQLPTILSRFRVPAGSAAALQAEKTLRDCEAAPSSGDTKVCSTSLESMVDFATKSLGTRNVAAVSTEGVSTAGKLVAYKVGAVRKLAAAGGKGAVSCHPLDYLYSVFGCHYTTTREVYEVEMEEEESGGKGVKAVAVCHMDTSGWDPKYFAFRVLKVKPGTVPVCHFLPKDHVLWVEN